METPRRDQAGQAGDASQPQFTSEDVFKVTEEPAKEAAEKAVEEAKPEQPPEKKAYYSPGEVMKKKGCIGCGGMALAVTVTVALLAALAAAL